VFIRTVLASVAKIAIIPLQDVLGLGSDARMNLPGTLTGNWKWRYKQNALTKDIGERLRKLVHLYDR
jgi:4-alpha-glucanotransferase